MSIRQLQESDYDRISPVMNDWWGGRQMVEMMPRLFFKHFNDTSFILEDENGEIIGFLVGFLSQTKLNEAYIHFVGVHPEHRRVQAGKTLYEAFYAAVKQRGRDTVGCLTSKVNRNSYAFHTRMGFSVVPGNGEVDGISIHKDYDGPGNDIILFKKNI